MATAPKKRGVALLSSGLDIYVHLQDCRGCIGTNTTPASGADSNSWRSFDNDKGQFEKRACEAVGFKHEFNGKPLASTCAQIQTLLVVQTLSPRLLLYSFLLFGTDIKYEYRSRLVQPLQ